MTSPATLAVPHRAQQPPAINPLALQPSSPSKSSRRQKTNSRIAIGAFIALAVGVGVYVWAQSPKTQRSDLLYHRVRREPLQLTVVERGALESADNRDVVCRVRAGTKASSLTLKWVIDDGTLVKQGQLLVEVDDSALQDQLKAQKINLDTARANKIQADENYKIAASQADSAIATAKVNLEIAKIDVKKYLEGEYVAAKKDLDGKIKLAQSDCELQTERVNYTERMVRLKYLSPAQLQAEQSKQQGFDVALEKAREDLRVLDNYTKQRTTKFNQNAVDEAARSLEREIIQQRAKIIQAESDRLTKKSIYEQEEDKYQDIEDQIVNCRMYSPQDGLVVYYVSEQSRFGSGSSQSIVAVGEPVKEGQRLMRIPDLSRMVVNTKIHEAMVSRVHGEEWRQTGLSDILRATLMFDPDAVGRLLSSHTVSDLKDKLPNFDYTKTEDGQTVLVHDKFHNVEYKKTEDGQAAVVRIDAFPERVLPGHVKSVATVASQQDWMSADVKVYQTFVSVDESVDGLKPGMSAEVTIKIDGATEEVLALPLQAILGGAELGPKRKCWVKAPGGPQEREIIVGLWNEKMAEVRAGLDEGDEVVVNPKALLGEKVKVRTGADADRPDPLNGDHGKKDKDKGKGKNGNKAGYTKDKGAPVAGKSPTTTQGS